MIKTKIEIGKPTAMRMTYDEAVMYCFALNINGKIGWRLPTYDEYCNAFFSGWYQDDPYRSFPDVYIVTPVRDLKDD